MRYRDAGMGYWDDALCDVVTQVRTLVAGPYSGSPGRPARADLHKADLKMFTVLGCYGASIVIVSLHKTRRCPGHAQRPARVYRASSMYASSETSPALSLHPMTNWLACAQLLFIQSDIPTIAIKVGMLSTRRARIRAHAAPLAQST